jgi:ankyrin repeat protein
VLVVLTGFGIARTLASQRQEAWNRSLLGAVQQGNLPAIRTLLRRGADPNARVVVSLQPAQAPWQILLGRFNAWWSGAAGPANPRRFTLPPILFFAVESGQQEIVTVLLDHGAKVDTARSGGVTALMRAIEISNADMVRLLVRRGANVNIRTASGRTPLMQAVKTLDVGGVEFLLDRGADVNAKTVNGSTTLMEATYRRARAGSPIPILRLLLDSGADLRAADRSGRTALQHAYRVGDREVVRFLKTRGAAR